MNTSEGSIGHDVSMNTGNVRRLRCYAWESGATWEAICVDFDIATFASSLDEVKASLATCVEMFLEDVDELPPGDRQRLLHRRAPWPLRVKLATLAWWYRLRNDAHQTLRFTLQSRIPSYF